MTFQSYNSRKFALPRQPLMVKGVNGTHAYPKAQFFLFFSALKYINLGLRRQFSNVSALNFNNFPCAANQGGGSRMQVIHKM